MLEFLSGLFGNKNKYLKIEDKNVFRLRVRTLKHGDIVELRFTKSSDIAADDKSGYIYRKMVVSSQHCDRGEVTVRFNQGYRVTEVIGDGVEPVLLSDWA